MSTTIHKSYSLISASVYLCWESSISEQCKEYLGPKFLEANLKWGESILGCSSQERERERSSRGIEGITSIEEESRNRRERQTSLSLSHSYVYTHIYMYMFMYLYLCVHVSAYSVLWPSVLLPTRLPCSLDFPHKNTGVSCPFLFQGIFPTQGSNPHLQKVRTFWWQNHFPS